MEHGNEILRHGADSSVLGVGVSRDGKSIAMGSSRGTLYIFEDFNLSLQLIPKVMGEKTLFDNPVIILKQRGGKSRYKYVRK